MLWCVPVIKATEEAEPAEWLETSLGSIAHPPVLLSMMLQH
jgi:hypothetical protein